MFRTLQPLRTLDLFSFVRSSNQSVIKQQLFQHVLEERTGNSIGWRRYSVRGCDGQNDVGQENEHQRSPDGRGLGRR